MPENDQGAARLGDAAADVAATLASAGLRADAQQLEALVRALQQRHERLRALRDWLDANDEPTERAVANAFDGGRGEDEQ